MVPDDVPIWSQSGTVPNLARLAWSISQFEDTAPLLISRKLKAWVSVESVISKVLLMEKMLSPTVVPSTSATSRTGESTEVMGGGGGGGGGFTTGAGTASAGTLKSFTHCRSDWITTEEHLSSSWAK